MLYATLSKVYVKKDNMYYQARVTKSNDGVMVTLTSAAPVKVRPQGATPATIEEVVARHGLCNPGDCFPVECEVPKSKYKKD